MLRPYVFLGEQLPLRLYWAISMDKSQGQTIKKAVIHLGKSETTTRLAKALAIETLVRHELRPP